MILETRTAETYLGLAVTQMHGVADRLGDDRVNQAPFGAETNSVAVLVAHCCGVSEFWLGHVGLGRPTSRVRDEEFTATATVPELHDMLAGMRAQIAADVRALDAGEASPAHASLRQTLEDADASDAALVLHVLEELYQHLGHMQVTADALAATT
jgi:uncharacterized damage-inducible protein DinB